MEKITSLRDLDMRMYILWILLLKSQTGHVGMKQLNRLLKHDLVVGLKNVKFDKDKFCSACQAGKKVANSHPSKSVMSTERHLKLLHMDFLGPTTYRSIGGIAIVLRLWMIIQDIYGFSFFMTRPIHMAHSKNS